MQYGDDAMKDYIRRYGRKSNQRSLLTKMLTGDPGTGIEPLTDAEISVEVSNLIFAATDTTGNTITYALYELCCHPEWQKKLREEIRASGAMEAGFSYQSVQSLPILNGVFTETLRLHPAAPSALPRITTGNGCRIGDIDVPGGVINLYAFPFPVSAAGVRTDSLQTLVSMQPFTVQRDPKYFSDPDKFSPDRWVSNGEIEHGSPDVREMMIPWGRGPRTCIGKHMATMESKISLARMIADFEVQLAGEKTHDEMVMTDHFTLIPKGQRCGLIFSEV
jgi:cytochrome P450